MNGDTSAEFDSKAEIKRKIADLLNQVLVRAQDGYAVQVKLRGLQFDGDAGIERLIARAQGAVGMVNSSAHSKPHLEMALQDVAMIKNQLRV